MSFTKKSIIQFFMTVILLSFFSVPAFAQLKIGYIRPRYIFEKYEPYKEAERKVQEFEKTEMEKLQNEQKNFQAKVEDYQKKAVLMSEDMQAQTQQELVKQKESLDMAMDELYRQDGLLSQKQAEYIEPIIKDINEVLMRIGETDGYDLLLDAEQGLLFADEKYDISDYILEELQKGISTQ